MRLSNRCGLAILASLLPSCSIGYPFRGPGFDPVHGVVHRTGRGTVVLAITHGVLTGSRSTLHQHLDQVREALAKQPGLIGFSARMDLIGSDVWTMSAWTDERSLRRFLAAAPHRAAATGGGLDRSSVRAVLIDIESTHLPISWREARRIFAERAPQR